MSAPINISIRSTRSLQGTARNTLAVAIALWACAPTFADFTPGDVYLVSSSLPSRGTLATPGIYRYQPGAGTGAMFLPLPNGSFGPSTSLQAAAATYDPYRDRLLLPMLNGGVLGTVDANGTLGTIPIPAINFTASAIGPNGIVYLLHGTTIRYLDANNASHELLDQNSATINLGSLGAAQIGSAIYDVGTTSLLVAATNAGNTRFVRLPLNGTGTQLASAATVVDRDLIGGQGESVAGMSAGPNGSIYVTLDINANGTFGLLQTINPDTLLASVFATTSGFNDAALTTGTWIPSQGLGLALDTGADVIRGYAMGGSGSGTIVASGASSAGGSGEAARMITIGGTINGSFPILGDLNGDGLVNATDLAILLGAWGPCQTCAACTADLNGDCTVSAADIAVLLGNWS